MNAHPWFVPSQNTEIGNVPHEKLAEEVVVQQPGYVYIYLSNDNGQPLEVFFDDFTVTHSHSAIVQADDYYPFGMTFNSYRRELGKLNDYLYQGKERSEALGWDDFHARMYSPALGRFFRVDPQDQFASPFIGMGNNPVMMVDPDGEFALLAGLTNGFRNLIKGDDFFKGFGDGWRQSWEITGGLFQWDGDLNFGENLWNAFSKSTWELPQTTLGFSVSQTLNVGTLVNDVNYFRGATLLDSDLEGGAFTLGSYIVGPEGFKPDFKDHLFVHEYGHYLQSQRLGPLYMSFVALPSVTDFYLGGRDRHDTRWYEAHASRLAANYFDQEFGAGANGYFVNSPNHFDRNSFINGGVFSPYFNPRNGGRNQGGHPQQSRLHWTDVPINLGYNVALGLLGYWFL